MRKLCGSLCFTAPLVAVLMASWVVASNHCGIILAGYLHGGSARQACCEPEKPTPEPCSVQCCAKLNAPLPAAAAAPVAHFHEIEPAWPETPLETLLPTPSPLLETTGYKGGPPPGALNQILFFCSRCAPAHAPPVFVA